MKGAGRMKNETTLKQALRSLKKKDLVNLGKNHGIDAPYKLKKEDLVMVLKELLPKKYTEELYYFLPNELMLYSDEFIRVFHTLDHTRLRASLQKAMDDGFITGSLSDSNKDFSPEDVIKLFEVMVKMALGKDIVRLRYLINMGYAFLTPKDNYSTVKLPSELKEVLFRTMKERGDELLDYQSLQSYILSLTNLYGVCSYHQLHKMHKTKKGSSLTLKKARDYVLKFSEKRPFCVATDNYLYSSNLNHEEFKTIVRSTLNRDYYNPTKEELPTYKYRFFGPEAIKIYDELKELFLNHSKTVDPLNEELVSYSEALESKDNDILAAYEKVLNGVMFYAKMGFGLYDFVNILDREFFKFNSLAEMNRAYSLYLDLQKHTRKWPLKGALYSEL